MPTEPETTATTVTVLGLGEMGSAIARALISRGHTTTVWNRTASRATALVAQGASAAPTVAAAVVASDLVVLCVLDYDAVDDVLADVGDAISGKSLVNVTSGAPDRARSIQRWASQHGADYLDGGILGDPADVGSERVLLSFSGSQATFTAYQATPRQLGTPTFYGDDAGLASVEFMARVAVGYELLMGFLHTLHLVEKEGIDPGEFAARVAATTTSGFGQLLTAIGQAVSDREYLPDLGPLTVQVALMGDLVEHRRSLGVDTTRMDEVKTLMEQRVTDGRGHEGFSSLFALLGQTRHPHHQASQ